MMFGFGKRNDAPPAQGNDRRGLFVKINGDVYTEDQMRDMSVPELDTLIVKLDMAIDDCSLYIEHKRNFGTSSDQSSIHKSEVALRKLKQGRTFAVAVRRQKQGTVKADIEHYFMQAAKRELTENQYNRIMVKAQAEYELQD